MFYNGFFPLWEQSSSEIVLTFSESQNTVKTPGKSIVDIVIVIVLWYSEVGCWSGCEAILSIVLQSVKLDLVY